ncbi:MAG: helix-turn-helix domain-containing protein [Sarcina sp.]
MSKFYSLDKKYFEYLESKGIKAELVFKSAGVPIKALNMKNVSITRKNYIDIMDTLDKIIDKDKLLSYADIDEMIGFIPPLFAGMCSKDGETCFNVISKYKKLIGPFIFEVFNDGEILSIEFKFDDSDRLLPRFAVISEQILMLNIIRKATGENIIPIKIISPYDYDETFSEFLGINPTKGNSNIISFKIEDMKKPFLTENNVMWSYLEPELKKRIDELEIDNTFSASVRSVLFEKVPSGEGTIEVIAQELAVSVRSLQRKLANENTTFLKQLNHTRELLARSYLKDGKISNDEIAFLIGYSDSNSFIRAFKNWTGMTITEYKFKYIDNLQEFESKI